jgi:sugar-specific transcriptional regulator TrmB
MEKKGYVKIRRGSPAYFRCTNPEQLTSRLRDEFLLYLKETLKELNSQATAKADVSRLGPLI